MIDLNDGTEHLNFHIIRYFHMVHYVDYLTGIHSTIIREGFDEAIASMKVQCTIFCDLLVIELK